MGASKPILDVEFEPAEATEAKAKAEHTRQNVTL